MLIRKAKAEESQIISYLILLAMEDIVYGFIEENSFEKAVEWLNSLVKEKNNQYSYENCWVAQLDHEIVAAALVYNGVKLQELRDPVAKSIKSRFHKDFNPEDETQAGEYYIDCVGVHPNKQGKGIGSQLFRFLIDEYVYKRNQTLGLLVDDENPDAKKLYLKLGFKVVNKKIFAGKNMEHLQFTK